MLKANRLELRQCPTYLELDPDFSFFANFYKYWHIILSNEMD